MLWKEEPHYGINIMRRFFLIYLKGDRNMSEKRRDNKGRILHNGEFQMSDGRYRFKYTDSFGKVKFGSQRQSTRREKEITFTT